MIEKEMFSRAFLKTYYILNPQSEYYMDYRMTFYETVKLN